MARVDTCTNWRRHSSCEGMHILVVITKIADPNDDDIDDKWSCERCPYWYSRKQLPAKVATD